MKSLEEIELERSQVKRMSPKEFQELGFLQELNRCFLHPLGLALEILVSDDGEDAVFGDVWDYRDDPEGILFSEKTLAAPEAKEKSERVRFLQESKTTERKVRLGWVVQPIPEKLEK